MQPVEEPGSETIEHLTKQVRFLLGIHQAELAQDPTSHATGSSRSNLMAVQHTVRQVYGEAVVRDVADLVGPACM